MPFAEQCSEWVKKSMPSMNAVTATCENEEYGRYRPGRRKGRCNDADLTAFGKQMAPACCGAQGKSCSNAKAVGFRNGKLTLPDPKDSSGNLICTPECAHNIEKFYAECHTRLEKSFRTMRGLANAAERLLSVCQLGGDGHRRLVANDTTAEPEDLALEVDQDGQYGEFSEFFEEPDAALWEGLDGV